MRFSASSSAARTNASGIFGRVLMVGLLAAALVGGFGAPRAEANNKYSSIVVAEETGEVLYARSSQVRRYPASLTKVMTLYLLFEDLSAGKLTLDSTFTASAYAARQPPSKLGIKKGQKIKVRDAIKALVVRSANDVAVVVAEGLSGSERSFAKRMTRRARALGMSKTTFRNASGLPNRRQTTTAHDLSILGRSIARDFPQYFHWFSTKEFSWHGQKWRTHNHVLKNYKGADGIKTGYTRASGFNLLTSAERNGVRLIGVVLGGRTPKRRDRDMARIMNLTYGRIKKNPSKYKTQLFASAPMPVLRPGTVGRSGPAPVRVAAASTGISLPAVPARKPGAAPATIASIAVASLAPEAKPDSAEAFPVTPRLRTADAAEQDAIAAKIAEALVPDTKPAQEPAETAPADKTVVASLEPQPDAIGKRITVPLASAASSFDSAYEEGDGRGVYPVSAVALEGNRGIQVGAFTQLATATEHMRQAVSLAGGALVPEQGAIVPAQTPSGKIFRVRFGPMADGAAGTACKALERRGLDCFPIQDENWGSAIRP